MVATKRSARLCAAFLILGSAALLFGQTETGQITGTVMDPSGAAVPGATVLVRNTQTGAERTAQTTGAGAYTVSNLLPAEYEVSANAPGFATSKQNAVLTVGGKLGLDFKLQVGQTGTTVQVAETAVLINTETQTLATTVSQTQLRELPTLTRNPYSLVAISGNVSDASAGNRGVGYSINGQRQASTNVLLDGAANNNEFVAGIGQSVPLDSVQEYSVLTNNFTAEFGRASGGVVNVVTKSGTNDFHGTAYEFNRVSRLSSNTFDNNSKGLPKSVFTRNQFGYSFGGPIKRNKLFFFSSTEWIRVRSLANETAFVPTNQLLALSAPNTQAFFNAYGTLKPDVRVIAPYSVNTFRVNGVNLCGSNRGCNLLDPNLPLFNQIGYTTNQDAGGGAPQNQYQTVFRVDYNVSDRTQVYARYALQNLSYLPGFVSFSPYVGYDTLETDFNNNGLVSLTHAFSPTLVSQSKAVFNRLNELQPFGRYPAVPTLYTGSVGSLALLNTNFVFPGYSPLTPGSGIPFGGPQNFVQLYQDFNYTRGAHQIRIGGSFDYQRDNRTFGAYETAGEYLGRSTGTGGSTVGGLLSGLLYQYQAAIDPQGKFPGDTVTLPLSQPNFSRSNRYREGAVYAQDSWKILPTFTLNYGVRWEYFGVQHNKNARLDSNFYDPRNQIDTPLGIRLGQVFLAPNSPAGKLWRPENHDFAPRIGFAWDLTGDGKTSLRAGYGIGYERNFGNVTFNAIQNPPNYETVSIITSSTQPSPAISVANLGPFAASSGTIRLPRASLRNVDENIKTAFSHLWSASLERQVRPGLVAGLDYTGSRGVHLYDISILNRAGYGNVFLGDPCAPGNCVSYLNPQYSGINRRGSRGYSNYNGLNFRLNANNVGNSGVTFTANYTWSHAIDTLSSTFSDSDAFSNNNGQFLIGYLDPYAPLLDKGSADFDIRHRFSFSAIWAVPVYKQQHGLLGQIFGGWEVAPIVTIRSGSPYSIFDSANAQNFAVRAGFTAPIKINGKSNPPSTGAPNNFNFLSFNDSIVNHFNNPIYGASDLPGFDPSMTGRNTFRAPGFWNFDLGLYKNFAISERFRLQLRGEAYNLVNHANLYVNGSGADVGNVDPTDGGVYSITSCRGCTGSVQDRRNVQLALKLVF